MSGGQTLLDDETRPTRGLPLTATTQWLHASRVDKANDKQQLDNDLHVRIYVFGCTSTAIDGETKNAVRHHTKKLKYPAWRQFFTRSRHFFALSGLRSTDVSKSVVSPVLCKRRWCDWHQGSRGHSRQDSGFELEPSPSATCLTLKSFRKKLGICWDPGLCR